MKTPQRVLVGLTYPPNFPGDAESHMHGVLGVCTLLEPVTIDVSEMVCIHHLAGGAMYQRCFLIIAFRTERFSRLPFGLCFPYVTVPFFRSQTLRTVQIAFLALLVFLADECGGPMSRPRFSSHNIHHMKSVSYYHVTSKHGPKDRPAHSPECGRVEAGPAFAPADT